MPDTDKGLHINANPAEKPLRVNFVVSFLAICKNILLILIGSYGLSTSLHILLRFMVGERSTIVAFFNTFAHLLWMPALILLPLMLITKQWRIALTLVAPVLMFVASYGALFLPQQTVTRADTEQTITIQTHNLLANNRTPEQLVPTIRDISADIVALQEVSADFEQRLLVLDEYPYSAIHSGINSGTALMRETMGQGILSRYPILEDEYWSHDYLPIPLAHQRVVIDVNGQPIVIYNVHPIHPGMTGSALFDPRLRRREIEDLLQRIQSETLPVLMIGDFNLTDLSTDYQLLTAHLIDTHREVGRGMGFTFPDFGEARPFDSIQLIPDYFPDELPIPLLMRLDYVFHSEEFRGISAYIHPTSGGSDHRPLVVTLAFDH